MTDRYIDDIFRNLVDRFGRDELQRRLEFLIENAGSRPKDALPKASGRKRKRNRAKVKDAVEHVESMDLPEHRKEKLRELAKRFEEKTFLPTTGDIKNMFYTYGFDTSSIKVRQASIPRVFFFLSSLSEERLRRILDDHLFSGPSPLGPLASAIKTHGRARRSVNEDPESFRQDGTNSQNQTEN